MDENRDLFHYFGNVEPPVELYSKVLAQIDIKKRRLARIKAAFFGTISMASLIAIIPAFQYVTEALQLSGFYQYFSLLFSDTGIVFMYWKEFILSLAESLPFMELAIFLSAIFILLSFAKLTVKSARSAFLTIRLV